MLSNNLGRMAMFALAANAFMIPSTMSLSDVDSAALLFAKDNIHSRLITVPCPGCLMPDGTKNVDNSIVLNMKVSEDGNQLLINDQAVYPNPASNFKLSQVSSDIPFDVLLTSLDAVSTEPRPVDFNLGFRAFPAADGSDAKVIDFNLKIFAIGGQKITVDKIYVRLLKGDSKETGIPGLAIHDVALVKPNGAVVAFKLPMKTRPNSVNFKGGPNKFNSWHPTAGAIQASPRPPRIVHSSGDAPSLNIKGGPNKFWGLRPEGGELDNPVQHGPRPHHRGHGPCGRQGGRRGHMRHHHALHGALRFMRSFVSGFVIPVMIGVAAGMTASILGMLVGSCIAWLWIKFVRGGRRGTASVSAEESAVGLDSDEKKRLMADEEETVNDEPLPVYTESEKQ